MGSESGLNKIAEGREAEMFAWENGSVLRLLRNPNAEWQNQIQAAALESARVSGVRVPEVKGITTVMGRPGLLMERIEGTDYLTLLGRQPWLIWPVGRLMGEEHAKLHETVASDKLPALRAVRRMRIEWCDKLPDELRRFALSILEGLPDGDSIYHGDFHPGNMLKTAQGPVVIDWTNAARGDSTADVARTHLMLRVGEPPPGSSAVVRVFARIGGNILVRRYLSRYRRLRPLDVVLFTRWQVPIAAARMAEGIENEFPALLRFLERARGNQPNSRCM